MQIKLKKIKPNAIIPSRMTSGSVGYDIYACIDKEEIMMGNEVKVIPTGIAIEIPEGFEGQIRPRSGLARKNFVTVLNSPGTIDSDFSGQIEIILINHSSNIVYIRNGMRIAQLIIAKCEQVDFEVVTELNNTERGNKGFGSTGN